MRVFANGRTAAYVRNDLPCESITIDAQQPASLYVQPGLGRWQRESRDGRIVRATAEVTVFGHETFDAPPETEGPIAIRINATFEAMGGTGTTRPGRLESIGGTVSGTLTLGADTIDLGRGLGHWHEQMQAETRWQDPFSYMSLWGEGLGIIGRQMWNEGGFVDRGGHMTRIVRVDQDASETLDLPEDVRSRRLTFHLEDGTTLPVVLETQYRHLRRVRGLKWQGDGVRGTVGGVPVVGFYNRFPVPRGAVIPRL